MSVRPERADDVAAVRAVNVAAFTTPAEADLVERLRADGDLLLSLVAEREEAIVGHVAFSPIAIEHNGSSGVAVALAPVAVLPQHQRGGVGMLLIGAGLARLKEQGQTLVFVLGDPAYYGRFGFSAAEAAPFASDYSGPFLQARRLVDQAVAPGRLRYAPAFAALG